MHASILGRVAVASFVATLGVGCTKDEPKRGGDVPPPPPSATVKPGACANPGTISDAEVAKFFPKTINNYCIDPAPGAVKVYGAKDMDKVCTQAFDGECEIYKQFGLEKVVTLRYIDGAGSPGIVDVIYSLFKDEPGSYGMFTKRVIADGDPAGTQLPKPVTAPGAAAVGGGRGYGWRGPNVVELTYMNEGEVPDKMKASSEALLPAVLRSVNDRMTGKPERPAVVKALPEGNMIPLGVFFAPKDALGIKGITDAAIGYYKDGTKRYRFLVAMPAGEPEAKAAFAAAKAKPGALPVPAVGDEATQVVFQTSKESPKAEWVFARKAGVVYGIGDEELALDATKSLDAQKDIRLTKDEKLTKLKAAIK